MNNIGRLHVYCGDGKGKTTAALGLALRARGAGMRVVLVQFLKSADTAELDMLRQLGVDILRARGRHGFTWQMTTEEKDALRTEHGEMLARGLALCGDGRRALLVLDEFSGAVSTGLLDRDEAVRAVLNRPEALELVVTGREPPEEVEGAADYVTEMRKRRHPMDAGVTARRGIEF